MLSLLQPPFNRNVINLTLFFLLMSTKNCFKLKSIFINIISYLTLIMIFFIKINIAYE